MGECHKPGHLSRGGWPSTPPLCDRCGKFRNHGDHTACSKARQAANNRPSTIPEGNQMQLPHALIDHFATVLHAPLATLDSTSAVRPDGSVVLVCWADRKRSLGGPYPWRLLAGHGAVTPERREHVERVVNLAPAYLVVATADDVNASPRTMRTFNAGMLVPVGLVRTIDGEVWAQCLPPVPVRDA